MEVRVKSSWEVVKKELKIQNTCQSLSWRISRRVIVSCLEVSFKEGEVIITKVWSWTLKPPLFTLSSTEIFGPILPIMPIDSIKGAVDYINSKDQPLALYMFSSNQKNTDYMFDNTRSGACLQGDVLLHFAVGNLPFGGTGPGECFLFWQINLTTSAFFEHFDFLISLLLSSSNYLS